jgi:hypothetical protein
VRRRGAALVLALAVAAAVTGCGVKEENRPHGVGKAPGFGGEPERQAVSLPDPSAASDARKFVDLFLQSAAAGDWDPVRPSNDRIAQAVAQGRKFLTAEAAAAWKHSNRIIVVQVEELTATNAETVSVKMHPVGVLTPDGAVEPLNDDPQIGSWTFTVQRLPSAGNEFRMTNPPPELLLSTQGLQELFEVRPVYFWDLDERYLLADRRYVSRGATRTKQIQTAIDRLIKGPSSFIASAVQSLPDNTSTDSRPVIERDRIVVNLSAAILANDKDWLNRLAGQIRWSLHPERHDLELQIAGRRQAVYGGNDYLSMNPSYANRTENDLYGLLGKRVVQWTGRRFTPDVLNAPENNNVVAAAVNRTRNWAALVRENGAQQELWIGRFDRETGPGWVRTALTGTSMSRPAYIPGGGGRVLVAVDGTVWDVGETGPPQSVGAFGAGISALAIAPDGSRLAYVANGLAYVATLNSTVVPVSRGEARALYTLGHGGLRGVGWSLEDQVVVAGANELMSVAIDNSYQAVIPVIDLFGAQITQLAAVPQTHANGNDAAGRIVIQAGADAFNVYPSRVAKISVEPSEPDPSGSAQPSTGTSATALTPTVPFYCDTG